MRPVPTEVPLLATSVVGKARGAAADQPGVPAHRRQVGQARHLVDDHPPPARRVAARRSRPRPAAVPAFPVRPAATASVSSPSSSRWRRLQRLGAGASHHPRAVIAFSTAHSARASVRHDEGRVVAAQRPVAVGRAGRRHRRTGKPGDQLAGQRLERRHLRAVRGAPCASGHQGAARSRCSASSSPAP